MPLLCSLFRRRRCLPLSCLLCFLRCLWILAASASATFLAFLSPRSLFLTLAISLPCALLFFLSCFAASLLARRKLTGFAVGLFFLSMGSSLPVPRLFRPRRRSPLSFLLGEIFLDGIRASLLLGFASDLSSNGEKE